MNMKHVNKGISNFRKMSIIVINTPILLTAEHFLVAQ